MKFTIRDLLLVTVIVAVCAAWWVDRSRLAKRAHDAEEQSAAERRLLDLIDPDWGSRTIKDLINLVPDSSAPAPNPPKE